MQVRRWIPLLLVVVLVIILGAAYRQLTPTVISLSPQNDATGIFVDTPVRLEFSRQMDADSVLENLEIVPNTPGEFTWEDNALTFAPDEPWPQGTLVEVRLSTEARSTLAIQLREAVSWSFTVERTLLAYLFPAEGPSDIYALDIISGEIMRFTTTQGVLDFEVDSEGMKIYYSAVNQEAGSDIYIFDRAKNESALILDCGSDLCRNPKLHPDGSMLAYERYGGGLQDGADYTQVWLIPDLSVGETEPVLPRSETRLPQWSPDGLLSYYRAALNRFEFVDLDSGEKTFFSNTTGESGTWLPDGSTFITTELFASQLDTLRGPSGEAQNQEVAEDTLEAVGVVSSHLMAIVLDNRRITDLTRDSSLEDTAPVASPNGRLLAIARKYIDEIRWTPGRQLWLMQPGGGEAIKLTDDPDFMHAAFAWHPGGLTIAFVRFNLILFTEQPELWVIDTDGRNAIQLIIGGYAPQWIP